MSSNAIRDSCCQAARQWTGCDWTTRFGRSELNLNGMQTRQAVLMARATAGDEAADWWDAARWLAQVEQDAQEAAEKGRTAVSLADSGKLTEALKQARRACAIESAYHDTLVWQSLREAVEKALAAETTEA